MKKVVKESLFESHDIYDIADVEVVVKSHPRSDHKILAILNSLGEASVQGGIGNAGWRIMKVKGSSVGEVSDELAEYIEDGTVLGVDYIEY
jgi:hypothetical protein